MKQTHKNAVMVVGAQGVVITRGEYQQSLINRFKAGFFMLVMCLVLMPLQASAAIDVAGALTTFGDVNTAIPLIGAAFLAALGILAAWKLIRGAFA